MNVEGSTFLVAGGGSAPSFFDPCSVTSQFRKGALGASAAQALLLCQTANSAGNTIAPEQFTSYVQTPGSQLTILLEGNPAVRPEKSNSYTLGAVFSTPASSGILSTLRGDRRYRRAKRAIRSGRDARVRGAARRHQLRRRRHR